MFRPPNGQPYVYQRFPNPNNVNANLIPGGIKCNFNMQRFIEEKRKDKNKNQSLNAQNNANIKNAKYDMDWMIGRKIILPDPIDNHFENDPNIKDLFD